MVLFGHLFLDWANKNRILGSINNKDVNTFKKVINIASKEKYTLILSITNVPVGLVIIIILNQSHDKFISLDNIILVYHRGATAWQYDTFLKRQNVKKMKKLFILN